jgi:arylsulfatase
MATFIELAQTNYPVEFEGRQIRPQRGRSITPVLKGKKIAEHKVMTWEHEGHGGIRMGDWKLVTEDIFSEDWELYNIASDRTEINDLLKKNPQKVTELKAVWEKWAYEIGVLPK